MLHVPQDFLFLSPRLPRATNDSTRHACGHTPSFYPRPTRFSQSGTAWSDLAPAEQVEVYVSLNLRA